MIGVTESAVEVESMLRLEKIWADYLNSNTVVCSISKSVSMTMLRYIVTNIINLSTQYLSASNVISAFTVRTVY
jgi:uncharacterized protein (DUF2062 family)